MSRFDDYLSELVAACEQNPFITGLVLMGSTADRARVDEWSDHDFAVIEFAVTDLGGLATFAANAWEVAYGGEPVTSVMLGVAAKAAPRTRLSWH